MMQGRPVVAFPWDAYPDVSGVVGFAKKVTTAKALDTELRARIDALSLTIHPMMAIDATRLPRGAKPEVRPGKMVLTNGDPREALQPFNFGQVSQITFAQAGALQQMVQQATEPLTQQEPVRLTARLPLVSVCLLALLLNVISAH